MLDMFIDCLLYCRCRCAGRQRWTTLPPIWWRMLIGRCNEYITEHDGIVLIITTASK